MSSLHKNVQMKAPSPRRKYRAYHDPSFKSIGGGGAIVQCSHILLFVAVVFATKYYWLHESMIVWLAAKDEGF